MTDALLESCLRAALQDVERTPIEGAAPVLALVEGEPDLVLQRALRRHATLELELERRGAKHGRWIELPEELDPRAKLPRLSKLKQRYREGRPLVFSRVFAKDLAPWRNEIHALSQLPQSLVKPSGLRRFVGLQVGQRGSRFALDPNPLPLVDPQRDLERVALRSNAPGSMGDGPTWVKLGRLSDHAEDKSLRLRFGIGEEGPDDAVTDLLKLQQLAQVSKALLPVRGLLEAQVGLWQLLEAMVGRSLLPSADIVYWNQPQGGALFHHDAFAEQGDSQAGVLFCQLAGRTAWLALSIADLARRVQEFAGFVAGGELPWLREALAPTPVWPTLAQMGSDRLALMRELGLPGCGRLGALVNRGPEFSSYLANCGHALILRPGDAFLLPNQGLLSTAMHSVFCASNGPNAAFSLGLFVQEPIQQPI